MGELPGVYDFGTDLASGVDPEETAVQTDDEIARLIRLVAKPGTEAELQLVGSRLHAINKWAGCERSATVILGCKSTVVVDANGTIATSKPRKLAARRFSWVQIVYVEVAPTRLWSELPM